MPLWKPRRAFALLWRKGPDFFNKGTLEQFQNEIALATA
jgi:hypothetical protein